MAQNAPEFKDNEMYRLLRDENIEEFNKRKEVGETCDFVCADFRNLKLTGINADGIDFSGSYFRSCDLRGVDFSLSKMEGTSIHDAQISGALFPTALRAEEISLSLNHGTRMRYY